MHYVLISEDLLKEEPCAFFTYLSRQSFFSLSKKLIFKQCDKTQRS
jgi:hypothetical protein